MLYEVKVGAKNLDDVLKEKGKDFFKHDEFKNLAAKEGLGIGKNASGQDVLKINVRSGNTGNWNKELNYPKPNRIYKVNEHVDYHTDEFGRVFFVKGDFDKETLEILGRNDYRTGQVGKLGKSDNHGGHIIARILGGAGEKLNLVPMNGEFNRREWFEMEKLWADAIKDGKKVELKIEPVYLEKGVRPDKFKIEYKIGDGKSIERTFDNVPGGKKK
ncbi:hypothetical protein Spiro2_001426 [Spirobacillus cienkowskii]